MAHCEMSFIQFAPWAIALVALCALIYQIWTNAQERRYEKSNFCLKSTLEAWDQAYALLKDSSNSRVAWVTAARALQRGNRIAEGICEKVHRDVLDVQKDRYRRLFGDILGYDNPEKRGAFFYGATETVNNIEDAAKSSTQRIGERAQILFIPEHILKIIWDFAQFPKNYEDPIGKKKAFTEDELNNPVNDIIWPGLFEYLRFQRRYGSREGQIYPRNPESS